MSGIFDPAIFDGIIFDEAPTAGMSIGGAKRKRTKLRRVSPGNALDRIEEEQRIEVLPRPIIEPPAHPAIQLAERTPTERRTPAPMESDEDEEDTIAMLLAA